MADKFYNGKGTLLYYNNVDPIETELIDLDFTNFKLLACLDENGFSLSSADIDTSSKCSAGNFGENIGGLQNWSMNGSGKKIIPGVGDTRLGNNQLFKIARDNEQGWWALFDMAKLSTRVGVGRISQFDESQPNNDNETFSVAITGSGYIGDQDDITP